MSTPQKTPLNQWHHNNGARMVDFHGWEMPIQYDGILAEHRRTRTTGSLFDVSHMGEFYFSGSEALSNLQRLTINDVSKLEIGQVHYSALLYENGTFVDDITVYRLAEAQFMLCVNAGNVAKNFQWILDKLTGDVVLEDRSPQTGQIAIQGPHAEKALQQIVSIPLQEIAYYWFQTATYQGQPILVARMGYTGEDGFEVFCPRELTEALWKELIVIGKELEITPAGLGARDTLRLEAAFPLYGNDIDDRHNPLEAKLKRFISFDKGDFIGRDALMQAQTQGVSRRLISFVLEDRGIPRSHFPILDTDGHPIGEVTSGTMSPKLNKGIGMGYVASEFAKKGTKIQIEIRNKPIAATIIPGSFLKL